MNRGRQGQKIYRSDNDYRYVLGIVQETIKMWDLRVVAYCLMPNHYHLLVQTSQGNLSRCMRHINGLYTQYYNRNPDDFSVLLAYYREVMELKGPLRIKRPST
ncbi:transposase [Thermodesulfobacteriota bacterium]